MSFWSDAWDFIQGAANTALAPVATGSAPAYSAAAAGAAAGAAPSAEPGPKLKNPAAPSPTPGQAALNQIMQGPPVSAGEAVAQTAQGIVGTGPIAGSIRPIVVWAIIIVIALIGVWGLISPGGGVALIERTVTGKKR